MSDRVVVSKKKAEELRKRDVKVADACAQMLSVLGNWKLSDAEVLIVLGKLIERSTARLKTCTYQKNYYVKGE